MGQFFSPYLAMGNDPVGMVDPTGGISHAFFSSPLFLSMAIGGLSGGITAGILAGRDPNLSTGQYLGSILGGVAAGAAVGAGAYYGVQFLSNPWIEMDYSALIRTLNSFGLENHLRRKYPDEKRRRGARADLAGNAFEEAALESMGRGKNEDNYGGAIPDAISDGVDIFVDKDDGEPHGGRWWEDAVLIDAKTSSSGRIPYDGQIKAMFNWISGIRIGFETEYNIVLNFQWSLFAKRTNSSATDAGVGVLHLVTPAGTTISPKLLGEANKRNIVILQSITRQHALFKRRIIVSKPQRVNVDGSKSDNIPEGFQNKGGVRVGNLPDFR